MLSLTMVVLLFIMGWKRRRKWWSCSDDESVGMDQIKYFIKFGMKLLSFINSSCDGGA